MGQCLREYFLGFGMKFFSKYITTLMNDLRLGKKLIFIALIFTFPMVLGTIELVSGFQKKRDFILNEIAGITLTEPLIEAVNQIQKHKELSTIDNKSRPKEIRKIKATRDRINFLLKSYQVLLANTHLKISQEKLEHILKHWNNIVINESNLNLAQSNYEHARILKDLISLIQIIGNSSGIILDDDKESYYLLK